MEKTCKTCINLCNKRGEVEGCDLYKGEVQEMIKDIDKKLTVEEAVRIIQEEGYYDFERYEIGGNMIEVGEYVRSLINGNIFKVIEVSDLLKEPGIKYYKFDKFRGMCSTEEYNVKHSKNIIDLIEVRRFY